MISDLPETFRKRHRNRKRPKRRDIFCPAHGCYLDSVSPKRHLLYADSLPQLKQKGIARRRAAMLLNQYSAVTLSHEWLEAFWCEECQETQWYHLCKAKDGSYHTTVATREQWQQAQGVVRPEGNPSVGEFTRRQAAGLVPSKHFP